MTLPFWPQVAGTGATRRPAALAISGTPAESATVNVAYSGFTVTASGGIFPYGFMLASGRLPTGITLDPSIGVVSGTPIVEETQAGIVIRVMDMQGLTVDLAPFQIEVTTTNIGAPAFLGTQNTSAAANSIDITTVADTGAGTLIFVVAMDSEGLAPSSVTDSAGNTYTAGTAISNQSGNLSIRPFYAKNVTALGSGATITAHFPTADAVLKVAIAVSVTGINTTSPADVEGAGFKATSNNPNFTTSVLGHAKEIIWAFTGIETFSGIWTNDPTWSGIGINSSGADALALAYKIVSATTALPYSATIQAGSLHWGSNYWSFRGA